MIERERKKIGKGKKEQSKAEESNKRNRAPCMGYYYNITVQYMKPSSRSGSFATCWLVIVSPFLPAGGIQ